MTWPCRGRRNKLAIVPARNALSTFDRCPYWPLLQSRLVKFCTSKMINTEISRTFPAGQCHFAPALRARAFKAHHPQSRCIKCRRISSKVRSTSEKKDEENTTREGTNTYWETINALNRVLTDGDADTKADAAVNEQRESAIDPYMMAINNPIGMLRIV